MKMFMVYHKKHADISITKNSLNGYFLKQLLEHFNERERASEPLGYPPPPFPQLLIKRTRRSEQFKIFHKKYHDKKCYFETSYIFKGPL